MHTSLHPSDDHLKQRCACRLGGARSCCGTPLDTNPTLGAPHHSSLRLGASRGELIQRHQLTAYKPGGSRPCSSSYLPLRSKAEHCRGPNMQNDATGRVSIGATCVNAKVLCCTASECAGVLLAKLPAILHCFCNTPPPKHTPEQSYTESISHSCTQSHPKDTFAESDRRQRDAPCMCLDTWSMSPLCIGQIQAAVMRPAHRDEHMRMEAGTDAANTCTGYKFHRNRLCNGHCALPGQGVVSLVSA